MDVSQLERNPGQAQIVSLPRISGAMGLRSVNTQKPQSSHHKATKKFCVSKLNGNRFLVNAYSVNELFAEFILALSTNQR